MGAGPSTLSASMLTGQKWGSDDLQPSLLQVAKLTLTGAQIRSLGSALVTLLPAPGAGKWYEVDHVSGIFAPGSDAGAHPLVSTTFPGIAFNYGDPNVNTEVAGFAFLSSNIFSGIAASQFYRQTTNLYQPGTTPIPLAHMVNQPINCNSAGDTITGNPANDAALIITINYQVRTLS